MGLEGKVALVTGASSGIGKAIAERLAADGAKVAVNYRARHPEDQAAGEGVAGTMGDRGLAVGADVGLRADVEKMVADIVAKFGRLDIVVNNAGIEIKRPFLDITDEEWQRVLGVNLYGAFVVSQVACRQIVKQGEGGKLIFVSSVHEDIPFPGFTPYCVSKGGVRMMMRNLAIELAPQRINVNNIAPGAIATPINQSVLADAVAKKNAESEIPWGRFGRPGEVAAVASFLASAESEYVTGSTYYVDGGLTQQVTMY